MEDWSVLDLPQDPVPGDPAQIQTLAARLLREAQYAEQHASRLGQVAANSADLRMQGDYAPLFQQRLAQLPQQAAVLGPAHESCGRALIAYAQTLEQAKIESRAALSRGLQADAQYKAALQQFCTLAPGFWYTGNWRELDEPFALRYTQYQRPEVRAAAARVGAYAAQAERERQAAATMARRVARVAAEAEMRCAQAIRAAIPAPGGSSGTAGSGRYGGAAARTVVLKAARGAARGTATGWARRGVRSSLRDVARKHESKSFCGDPVDVATGRMALPQTDLRLPARLPLVFTRHFESSYRAGRWFGPTWTSTADQRLEIDAEGVIFVREDGSLLSYPHPTPEVASLPVEGDLLPLTVDTNGDYTVTDPDTGRRWDFAAPGAAGRGIALLAHVTDRAGTQRLTFAYDTNGAPTAIRHSAGYHLKISTEDERITALHLADAAEEGGDQELLRFGYDEHGHLSSVTKSCGVPTRFTNDAVGRITAWTDTNGSSYRYVYDDEDRCTYQSGEAGHLRNTYTYDDTDPATGLKVTTATDSLGHTSRYLINDKLQVVTEIRPGGAATHTTYDSFQRPLTITDLLGRTITYAYDQAGRPLRIVRPDGRAISVAYNDQGLPVTVSEPDGTQVCRQFDENGNLTSLTDAAGATTRYTYDSRGNLASVTDDLGHTTHIECNAAGLPLSVTDPLGAATRYERDTFGRTITIADPLGATTRLSWTIEGKLERRTDPDGAEESWTYDGEGNCTSHTDAIGGTTHFEYTHFDLLTARTGPDDVRYEFDHDTELRLTKITNPQGLTWTYEYDVAGRLVTETDFDDRSLTYEYDAAGRLASRRNALDEVTSFGRDDLGRVIRKDAAGRVTTYAYDLTDQLAEATGPDGTTLTLLRDRSGRLCSETVNGRTLQYTYDALGRRTGRTTPSGADTTWSYDAAGRRTGMVASGRTIDFTYDEAGRELTRHVGGAVTLEHTFDALGRLTTQSVSGAGGHRVQHRTYTYRADGNLIRIDDHLSGSRRFDLDATGRVTAVHAANWTERYAYDEAGNQTAASWPTDHPGGEATGLRSYVGTRITRAGNIRYEHDALGRITLRKKTRLSRKPDTWRYEWDAEDRLTSVVTPDGTRWRYTYDPLGRRTAKLRLAEDGETVVERVDFTWDGTMLCEQTTTSADFPNPVALTWDHQGLRPLSQTECITVEETPQQEIDARFFTIITDLVGTPTELINEQGDIAWRTRSTLWGTTARAANSTTYTPLRFPGQYYDAETDLHYNFFRYYDPELARYLTPDSLGLTPADNPVMYVHNPHTWSDPLGLGPCPPRTKDKGWDLSGDANPLSIIPKDAVQERWMPIPGGVEHGIKWKWTDDVTSKTVRMRVHGPDLGPHAGPNASSGPIYRIQVGHQFQDESGTLYHSKIGNPNSPNYNEAAINDTHIPWPSHLPVPYPH
ncbi:polymorphic toxin type 30 domain-containing protein [Streptomyces scopuliridis]|uniref:polymorphic toxin type 30 domain-containing protein n=1 Tax=Streptomyces scopuliridis TaxID=452529 RepID=UPI0036996134